MWHFAPLQHPLHFHIDSESNLSMPMVFKTQKQTPVNSDGHLIVWHMHKPKFLVVLEWKDSTAHQQIPTN